MWKSRSRKVFEPENYDEFPRELRTFLLKFIHSKLLRQKIPLFLRKFWTLSNQNNKNCLKISHSDYLVKDRKTCPNNASKYCAKIPFIRIASVVYIRTYWITNCMKYEYKIEFYFFLLYVYVYIPAALHNWWWWWLFARKTTDIAWQEYMILRY